MRHESTSLILIWLAVAGSCLLAAESAGQDGAGDRPNLLLIVVDTLRADAVGWVSGSDTTPAMDRLAAEGARFPVALAPVPLTLPSHASMLTGLLPRRHGVRDNGQVLDGGVPTLTESLRAQGYDTAAFISGYPLRRVFGLGRGFADYDDEVPTNGGVWVERPAPATAEAARRWLDARPRGPAARPWFLFVHFYDPHDPYEPPAAFRRPGPRGAYLGEVAMVDAELPALLAAADAASGAAGRLTVLTGDHGESLGEHGEDTHGFFLYDATVRVPLVLHFPGRIAPTRSHQAPRLIDMTPTCLDYLGIEPLPDLDGISLRSVLSAGRQVPPAYLETLAPWLGYGWSPLVALRSAAAKLVVAPRPEFYDLGADPAELRDLYDSRRPEARRLRETLREIEARPPVGSLGAASGTVDAEDLAVLRSLGYSGGASVGAIPPGLPDPKDRLAEKARIEAAEALHAGGRLVEALAGFRDILGREPANPFALLRSAQTLTALGRADEALPHLERLVRLDPRNAEARYGLADALFLGQRYAESLAQWRELVAIEPLRVAAWSNLGSTAAALGREEEAIAALERAVELEPGSKLYRSNLAALDLRRARRLVRQDRATARVHLLRALELDPRLGARVAGDPALSSLLP